MNEQSDLPVTKNSRINCGRISFILKDMICEVRENKDTIELNRLNLHYCTLACGRTKDDRIQPFIQEIQQLIGESLERTKLQQGHKHNGKIPKGNYGQFINTTNTPPIAFDVSFNSVNNANRINEVPEEVDAIMKDDSDVAICSPGEGSNNTDKEEVFKVH
ncbi:hypothetical protein AVEN_5843-1 [Araneus ventricosus]|uniref:Uncharacterized protein n=1 Tax=Araneus ventricosus TaxID=182803 RepID=A0A4Y2RB12_ARAVE|nr:hypothetical protein AVEN_5843-1 [Araneus ventricosus]